MMRRADNDQDNDVAKHQGRSPNGQRQDEQAQAGRGCEKQAGRMTSSEKAQTRSPQQSFFPVFPVLRPTLCPLVVFASDSDCRLGLSSPLPGQRSAPEGVNKRPGKRQMLLPLLPC